MRILDPIRPAAAVLLLATVSCSSAPATGARPAEKPDAEAEGASGPMPGEEEWGQSVNGLRLGVRATRTSWPDGAPPVVSVFLRNDSRRRIRYAHFPASFHCRLWVDGSLFEASNEDARKTSFGRMADLLPWAERMVATLTLGPSWRRVHDGRRLEPGPGPHHIRVFHAPLIWPSRDDNASGTPSTMLLSNAITIETAAGESPQPAKDRRRASHHARKPGTDARGGSTPRLRRSALITQDTP